MNFNSGQRYASPQSGRDSASLTPRGGTDQSFTNTLPKFSKSQKRIVRPPSFDIHHRKAPFGPNSFVFKEKKFVARKKAPKPVIIYSGAK